jgi:hypothetical protein
MLKLQNPISEEEVGFFILRVESEVRNAIFPGCGEKAG